MIVYAHIEKRHRTETLSGGVLRLWNNYHLTGQTLCRILIVVRQRNLFMKK